MRIRPYKTLDNKIEGVLIAWVDIDAFKRGVVDTQAARDHAQAIIETVFDPLLILDRELRVRTANHAFYQMFQMTPEQVVDTSIYEVGQGRWDVPKLRELLSSILAQPGHHENFELEAEAGGTRHKFALNARRTYVDDSRAPLLILAMEDVTQR